LDIKQKNMNAITVPIIAFINGAILGLVLGFFVAGHKAIIAGLELKSNLRILRFLFRRTDTLSLSEIVLLMFLSASWFVVFISLVAIPFWLTEADGKLEFAILLCSIYISFKLGMNMFRHFYIIDATETDSNPPSKP